MILTSPLIDWCCCQLSSCGPESVLLRPYHPNSVPTRAAVLHSLSVKWYENARNDHRICRSAGDTLNLRCGVESEVPCPLRHTDSDHCKYLIIMSLTVSTGITVVLARFISEVIYYVLSGPLNACTRSQTWHNSRKLKKS